MVTPQANLPPIQFQNVIRDYNVHVPASYDGKDAFGNSWGSATHKEDVPRDELMKRAAAFTASQGSRG